MFNFGSYVSAIQIWQFLEIQTIRSYILQRLILEATNDRLKIYVAAISIWLFSKIARNRACK